MSSGSVSTNHSDIPGVSRWRSFAVGARDTVPMLVGALPFGIIFGTLAGASSMAAWQGQLMSLLVYAGSSQFIAVGLVAANTGMLVIWLTTLFVNLRHMLYAASLLPLVAHLPLRWRFLLGFILTDETFAVVSAYHQNPRPDHPLKLAHWYFLGSGMAMYLNWQLWTLVGLYFGATFPQLQNWGMDYAMVATFIAIIVPQLRRMPYLAAALVSGALAYALQGLPYKLGLLISVLAGVLVGMLGSRNVARSDDQNRGGAA